MTLLTLIASIVGPAIFAFLWWRAEVRANEAEREADSARQSCQDLAVSSNKALKMLDDEMHMQAVEICQLKKDCRVQDARRG